MFGELRLVALEPLDEAAQGLVGACGGEGDGVEWMDVGRGAGMDE